MALKRRPVLVDNSLNIAFSIKYAIYALFGLTGMIVHIPSLAAVAGEAVATFLAFVVAVSGAAASVCVANSGKSDRWVRWEFITTFTLVAFVAVYNICLIYLAVIGAGSRVNLAVIATALLVLPVWKLYYILKTSR